MSTERTHTIETQHGKVQITDRPGGVTIVTDKLSCRNVTAHLGTVWADTDLAVCVNGQWLKDAFAAGQHRQPKADGA